MTTISELAQQFKKFQEQFDEPIENMLKMGSKFEDLRLVLPHSLEAEMNAMLKTAPIAQEHAPFGLYTFDRIWTKWGPLFFEFRYHMPRETWLLIDHTKLGPLRPEDFI